MADISLHILTKAEYEKNINYYNQSFGEIVGAEKPFDDEWFKFFKENPINTVAFLKEKNKIVSLLYGIPLKDNNGMQLLANWEEYSLETHDNYQRKGYGSKILEFGLKDMIRKGAERIQIFPSSQGFPLFMKIIRENGLLFSYEGRGLYLVIENADSLISQDRPYDQAYHDFETIFKSCLNIEELKNVLKKQFSEKEKKYHQAIFEAFLNVSISLIIDALENLILNTEQLESYLKNIILADLPLEIIIEIKNKISMEKTINPLFSKYINSAKKNIEVKS